MSLSGNELPEVASFLPLSPQDFQVLLAVTEGPIHGYGIVKASEDGHGHATLELGSLYRILARMLDLGLVEDAGDEGSTGNRRRRLYQATALGRSVVAAEARRLEALLASDTAARLLGSK